MIFHERPFLLLALPLVCAGYALLPRWRTLTLTAFSLALVALAGTADLVALLLSMTFNLTTAWAASRASRRAQPWIAAFAITANVAYLVFSKSAPGTRLLAFIPLGVSFYTFQQIGFQADLAAGCVTVPNALEYFFVISFFPHLAAGPIVRFRDIAGQLRSPAWKNRPLELTTANLTLLFLGLSKKVFIADRLAPWVTQAYEAASKGDVVLNFSHFAWATFGYGFQIYFDFSGYSDIAVALGLILGICLPFNFNSPYKSRSAIDFWARWHMSLSAWIREFVYLPIKKRGGTGPLRSPALLIGVMGLVGLWHGMSWMFLLWGLGHGLLIAINHGARKAGLRMPSLLTRPLTFLAVNLLWPLFRDSSGEVLHRVFTAVLHPAFTQDTLILVVLMAGVLYLPNSIQIWEALDPAKINSIALPKRNALAWVLTVLGVALVLFSDYRSEYIYFRF